MFVNKYVCSKCNKDVEYPVMSSHYMTCQEEVGGTDKHGFKNVCGGELKYIDAYEVSIEKGEKIVEDWKKSF